MIYSCFAMICRTQWQTPAQHMLLPLQTQKGYIIFSSHVTLPQPMARWSIICRNIHWLPILYKIRHMAGFSNWIIFSNSRVKLICGLDTDNAYIYWRVQWSYCLVPIGVFSRSLATAHLFFQLENLNIKFLSITFPLGQDEFEVFKH